MVSSGVFGRVALSATSKGALLLKDAPTQKKKFGRWYGVLCSGTVCRGACRGELVVLCWLLLGVGEVLGFSVFRSAAKFWFSLDHRCLVANVPGSKAVPFIGALDTLFVYGWVHRALFHDVAVVL